MVKKKHLFEPSFNYMDEFSFPTIRQKWLLLHTDPVWYLFILSGIITEAMFTVFMIPLQIKLFSEYHLFVIRLQQVFNFMYLCDIILAVRQKFFFKNRYPYPNPIRRPAPVMFIEFISVIPFEFIFNANKTEYSAADRRLYLGLLTPHILKIIRFSYHIFNNRREFHNKFTTRILEMSIVLLIVCGFAVHVLYLLKYLDTYDGVYNGFHMITCFVWGRGPAFQEVQIGGLSIIAIESAISVISILMWTIAIYPTCCFMILSFIENQQHRHDYSHLIHLFKNKISPRYKLPKKKNQMMMDYFEANWKLRGGFSTEEFDFAQKSLQVEIAMDAFYPAFKHSMLFRRAEFYILRAIADKFKRHIRMEGDHLFVKNKRKFGLVYIVQGVIEVLSAENNESGILALTAGSCIGEASLILPHISTVNFRCKTVCELFELPRQDFMQFQLSYPIEYKQLQIKLLDIVSNVRKIKVYNQQFNQDDGERKRLIWLKYQLHNLMSSSAAHKNTHEQTNIYLHEDLSNCVISQSHILHTVEYLDKLAIRERTFTDVDLVFIQNKCPWILKPGSPITNLWEWITVVATIVCSLAVSYGFCIEYTDTIMGITTVVHIQFALDLVVQIITPTSVTSDARTVTAVLSERLQTSGFFLDVISVYYWRMIAFALNTKLPWFELFKLVKLWRVWHFFETWSNKFLLNMTIYTVVLSASIYMALIYFLSSAFTIANISEHLMAPVTIQFATGAGLPLYSVVKSPTYSYMYVFANIAALIVELGVTCMVAATFYLNFATLSKVITIIHNLTTWITIERHSWLWVRLQAYFDDLRHEQDVILSQRSISNVYKLPVYFDKIMKSEVHFEALKRLHLLKTVSDEFINDLLVDTDVYTTYQHAVITSRGIIYTDVFVLLRGDCRSLIHGTYHRTKTYEPLNFLENVYHSPSVTTIVALTHCIILKFSFDAYLRLLYENHNEYRSFLATKDLLREYNDKIMMKLLYQPPIIVKSKMKRLNFKQFRFFAPKNSFEEFDYHVPFDKIKPLDFIKFILLRTTFFPEGIFLKYYEILRCIMAFLSACLFTIPVINIGAYIRKSQGYELMLALDLFAALDIYIRMHVCYYTPEGLLVTHPLKTAKHYLSHGFLIDVIAVFPFDIFPMKVQYRVLLNALHALQLHRIVALKKYYSTTNLYFIMNIIWMTSYTLVFANLAAGLIFVSDCYSWESEEQVPNANCSTFKFEKTNSHFHILFLVMSALECSGMSGLINVQDLNDRLANGLSALTVIGILMQILHRSYIFTDFITRIMEKYEYSVGVRRLIRLLKQRSDNSRYLCKEVANFYDLHWTRVGSQDMTESTKYMINALKRDMRFEFYGENLVLYSIFTDDITDTIMFIKNLLLIAKPMVIPKNGYGVTINDVEEYIYFINNGSIDILSADGSKVLELTAGSFYGNFSSNKYVRMGLSIVANVNTDLVYLSNSDFFKAITYFPKIHESFKRIVRRNVFYVEGTKPKEEHLTMTFTEYIRAVKKYSLFQALNYFHLFYVCYLGVCIELYQLAVGEMHIIYLAIQYSMDVVHLLVQYLKFRMPYKDEHRAPIFHRKKIVARQLRQRTQFYVMIITIIYLDIFLVLPLVLFGRYQISELSYVVTLLRLNRFLRIYYVRAAYTENQKRISQCFSNLVKWFYIIYWYVLSHQAIAAVTAILDSVTIGDIPNLIHNIPPDTIKNIRRLPAWDKFNIYVRYFFFSNLIHINSYDKYYKPTNTTFNVFIILLFIYRNFIESVFLCRFFEAMIDIVVLRRLYLRGASFLKFYIKKYYGSVVVKERVMENAKTIWTKNYYKSDLIMNTICIKYLKEVIINYLYGYLLRRHPVFAHTHIDFLRQLGIHLKKVIYPCNFVIVYQKEVRKCMFFIHKGQVAVYDVDFGYKDIALDMLHKGDSFGLIQGLGLYQSFHDYTYITTQHCEILELEWDSWNYLLPFFPASKEYIFEAAPGWIKRTSVPYLHTEVKRDY